MATYTSFFVASDDALDQEFPGWKRPLDRPTVVTRTNPFTRRVVEVYEWDPDPSQPVPASLEPPGAAVVEVRGYYDAYLENRARPLVRRSPHRCWKNVDWLAVEALRAVCMGTEFDPHLLHFPPARIGPVNAGIVVTLVAPSVVSMLAHLDDAKVEVTAKAWAEHSEMKARGFTPEVAAVLLPQLCELAREAVTTSKRLYLIVG